MTYLQFPYDAEDADELLAGALSRIAEQIPGWTPRETHLEYAVLAENVRLNQDTRLLAADVADAVYRSIGALFGLPPDDGAPATAQVVFVLTSDAGGTVPAGTQLAWSAPDGTTHLFATLAPASAAPGGDTTGPVTVAALDPGSAPNGLGLTGLTLIDSLAVVAGVQPLTPAAGGTDAESDADYLDRLTEVLTTVRPAPVLPGDFAVLAKRTAGVHRALAFDSGERTVTVVPLTSAGTSPDEATVEQLLAALDSEREINFVVIADTPTYTAVNVTTSVSLTGDVDESTVLQAVRTAVLDYLDPATWGGGDQRPPRWDRTDRVRYLELGALIDSQPGVRHVEDLVVNGGRVDVLLPGAAPLPASATHPTAPTTVAVTAV